MNPIDNRSNSAFRLDAQVWLWRHGWIWPLAAFLVALGVALQATLIPKLQTAVKLAESDVLQRTSGARAPVEPLTPLPSVQGSDEEAWNALYGVVYNEAEANTALRKIYLLAKAQGIDVAQSDFRTTRDGYGGLHRLQVTLPLFASYPQFLAFSHQLLAQLPGASLDQVQIARDVVSQGKPEIQVGISLWVDPQKARADAGPAVSPRS